MIHKITNYHSILAYFFLKVLSNTSFYSLYKHPGLTQHSTSHPQALSLLSKGRLSFFTFSLTERILKIVKTTKIPQKAINFDLENNEYQKDYTY